MSGAATTSSAIDGLTGLTGLLASLIGSAGEVGVGLLTLAEVVIPPIPSEVVLPLAGFLAQQGTRISDAQRPGAGSARRPRRWTPTPVPGTSGTRSWTTTAPPPA